MERVIFDNSGGIVLQLPEFTHFYDDPSQCADDIVEWIDTGDTSDWEGNDENAVFDPSQRVGLMFDIFC